MAGNVRFTHHGPAVALAASKREGEVSPIVTPGRALRVPCVEKGWLSAVPAAVGTTKM